MKKEYAAPVVEKITFDYRVQTESGSGDCFGSIINVATSESECGEGTPYYVGWNLKNPGDI